MDELRFWALVQDVHDHANGDMDEKCETLRAALSRLSREDATAFAHCFTSMMDRAYSWPLWGAAYVIHGGCGDDTFTDFRASLISRGRKAYESAFADPESLALEEFDDEAWFYEGYQYAVSEGVKAAAGSVVKRAQPHPDEPSGQAFDEEKVYESYPKLSEKFA